MTVRYCCIKKQFKCLSLYTVTSRLFTHIVSTEKMRKDIRDTKYTYCKSFFDIASN